MRDASWTKRRRRLSVRKPRDRHLHDGGATQRSNVDDEAKEF